MKIKELRAKTISELEKTIAAHRVTVRGLRFKDANKQVKNVKDIKAKKREIARMMTIVAQKKKLAQSEDKNNKQIQK